MNELSIWCRSHGSTGDYGVFRSAADLVAAGTSDTVVSVVSGADLLAVLESLQGETKFDRVVIAAHGGTSWLLDDLHGVTTRRRQYHDQVTVGELADSLAGVLADDPLISLAACMCSRSPTTWLREHLGRVDSDWGPRAYRPGGQASFSARLRDSLWHLHSIRARVRGHRASGHATALALLAEHRVDAADVCGPCTTLFERSLDTTPPDGPARRWWTRHVTGSLARRWLLGDDTVEGEIRAMWLASH